MKSFFRWFLLFVLILQNTDASSDGLEEGAPWPMYMRNAIHNSVSLFTGGSNTLRWSFTTGGDVYSSPAIGADGTVYIGSYDHIISM